MSFLSALHFGIGGLEVFEMVGDIYKIIFNFLREKVRTNIEKSLMYKAD